jgi:hypothetical protein
MKPNPISPRKLPDLDPHIDQQNLADNQSPGNKIKLSQWLLSLIILGGGFAIWQFLMPVPVP